MEDTKKNTFRSAAYPSRSLDGSLNDLDIVRKNLGKGSYSRSHIAQALGHSGLSGAAVRKVAALVHYGLLERVGNTYKYSVISDRILFPISEDDKADAIVEAALKPKLYASLVERYADSAVPSLLENILIQQYKLSEQVAKSAAQDFVKTMEFAGLLRNGILFRSAEKISSSSPSESTVERDGQDEIIQRSEERNDPKSGYIELPALPSGIIVLFPEELAPFASLGRFSVGLNELEKQAKEIREQEDI